MAVVVVVVAVLIGVYHNQWFPSTKNTKDADKKYKCDPKTIKCVDSTDKDAQSLTACTQTCGLLPEYYVCDDGLTGKCHLGTDFAGAKFGFKDQSTCGTKCIPAAPGEQGYTCNQAKETCERTTSGGVSYENCQPTCVSSSQKTLGFGCTKGNVCAMLEGGTASRTCEGLACVAAQGRCDTSTLTCVASTSNIGQPAVDWGACDMFCRPDGNACFGHGLVSPTGCTCATNFSGDWCDWYIMDFVQYPALPSTGITLYTGKGDQDDDVARLHALWTIGTFTTSPDTKSIEVSLNVKVRTDNGDSAGRWASALMLIDIDAVDTSVFANKFGTGTGLLTGPGNYSPHPQVTNDNNGSVYNMIHDPAIVTPLPSLNYKSQDSITNTNNFEQHADGFWYEKAGTKFRAQIGLPYDNSNYNHMIQWNNRTTRIGGIVNFPYAEVNLQYEALGENAIKSLNDHPVGGRRFAIAVYFALSSNGQYSIKPMTGKQNSVKFIE